MNGSELTTDTGYQSLTRPFGFPIGATPSHLLSWVRFAEMLAAESFRQEND
jgi:hypothetical protein